jgi:hypothetical protein
MNPSFAMSAYVVKDPLTRRKVDYRQTNLRYLVVVLAIFVIFGCEYCFDNPSVYLFKFRLSKQAYNTINNIDFRKHNSIYYTHFMHSQM